MADQPPAVALEDAEGMAVGQLPGTGAAEACEGGNAGLVPVDSAEEGGMSLLRMEEKFSAGQYRAIGEFAMDFRSVLSGCYRLHGAEHWLSRQARKLEAMLEQKVALLSRDLRNETMSPSTTASLGTLGEDKESECTSTRRRTSARSAANLNRGALQSVMVQLLKQAEFLRVKEEKRIKEQERKEAEEANQKEMEEWDRRLLALAAPSSMETMWEIPAIGHFLCLAQQILNLPEIVYYELERCLLMPQCNVFLSKIMTSLLSPPHRRPTLHRRPSLPYRAWETALKQKVQQWYTSVGQTENPDRAAEKLGLCSQFFKVLGEVNPLEQKTFHELTFQQKVWLLKGLCDFVYETQNEVQDAVLGQPIHECREVILGYDTQENAYIHFPQFCGADVRVYRQRPYKAPEFPIPPIKVKRIPKCSRSKSKCVKKNNGQLKSVRRTISEFSSSKVELLVDSSIDGHVDRCVSSTEYNVKQVKNYEDQNPCINLSSCFREGVELISYGEPLSPGEIRILNKADAYADQSPLKTDASPLKENALKTFDVHVNGTHTDSTDVICHQLAVDVVLHDSVLDQEKLQRLRAKRKKKKKKKDFLSDHAQGRCESHQNTFKSFKTELHNKLYLNKKRAKHKKHKSGKKFNSTIMVVKKKKSVARSPTVPEFQLVCTNLDDLRELIKKIDEELKSFEICKKKSGKWHLRRQGVKELHGTLLRLLNELLPWEPKLLKAFQRNRTRLKKDYDDFRKLHELENCTRESHPHGECKTSKSPDSVPKTPDSCQKEVLKKDCDEEQKVMNSGALPKVSNFLSNSPIKNSKRPYQPINTEDKCIFPHKKIKVNTPEISSTSTEGSAFKAKQTPEAPETSLKPNGTSPLNVFQGPKPIQALLAKNIGNKVTLTSQLGQSISRPCPSSESANIGSSPTQNTVKSPLSCQANLKSPLHMLYKLPDGQCVPIDLQNSPLKIQVQPIIDAKTGDKRMQQVLVLPKNIFIQTPEKHLKTPEKTSQENTPTQSNVSQHLLTTMALPTSTTNHLISKQSPLPLSQTDLFPCKLGSQPLVSLVACSASLSNGETSQTSASSFPAPQVFSSHSKYFPVQSELGSVTSSTENATLASQLTGSTLAPQRDVSEANQELKTVCIRDSQSILVRTRGGNTGVVKVQTNQDQANSVISPSPLFTFTPQLQSFLVPRAKSSTPSTFTAVSQNTTFSKIPTPSVGINQFTDSNTRETTEVQHTNATPAIQKVDHSVQANFIAAMSNSWPPASPQFNTNNAARIATPPSCSSTGQDHSMQKAGTTIKQIETKTSSSSVVQPDSTTPSKSDLVSGSPMHHPSIMLFTAPSIHLPGNSDKGMVVSPTKTAGLSKNLVLINTQLPNSPLSTPLAQQTSKQAASAVIGKPGLKNIAHPQILFIPSSIASPIKMSSAPIVSQVKDVKFGLTIGHTIVNNSGKANILPFNITPNTLGKGDVGPSQDLVVSVASTFAKMQNNDQVTSSNITCDYNAPTIKTSKACTVVTSENAAQDNDFLGSLSSLSTRSSVSGANVGSTVAISTVKTGHLSSSVLLSNTQMSGRKASTLQMPVSPTLLGTTSHLGAAPVAATYQPALKELSEIKPLSQNVQKGISASKAKPQATMALSLAPTLVKTGPRHAASEASPPLPASCPTQVKSQLNETSTLQKLVINTSTPLAPGTQITINGTGFIVPPQGLGAGSHVLLLSSNTKPGPPLVGNTQTCLGSTDASSKPAQPAMKQSSYMAQHLVQPCTNIYSTSKHLPVVQATSQTVNIPASDFPSCLLSTNALQTPLVSGMQGGSYPQQTNITQVSRGTPMEKAGVLNTVSPPCNL
ncbi:putative bromodomain-containing protein 10 [Gastrophryne carolinensis]